MNQIEVNVPASKGKVSQGTTVTIDGEKIEHVYSVEVLLEAGSLTRLTIKSLVKKGDRFQIEETEEGREGLVRQSRTYSFSGSISATGVLIDQETWVE